MSSLTFLEYDKILKDSNYDIEPKELEILTYRLSLFITPRDVKIKILNKLKDSLTTKYNIRVGTDESELIIDFGLSQLSFPLMMICFLY